MIQGDLVESVTRLRQEPGDDIMFYGFGPVGRTLLDHGLVDELKLWVHPIVVGTGEPADLLFGKCETTKLGLVDTIPLSSGVVILTCQPEPAP